MACARALVLGWVLLLMAACEQGGPVGELGGGERLIPEHALHIVSHEEDGEPALGSVRLMAWGPERQILVFDPRSQRIEVYDSSGWIRSMGGPGDGPGEFSPMVIALVPLPDGVAVVDLGNGRVSVVDYSGLEVGQQRMDAWGAGAAMHAAASPSDHLLVQFRQGDPEDGDSIRILWPPDEQGPVTAVPAGSSVTMSGGGPQAYRLLAPEVYWAPAEDGVYVVNSHEYTVRMQREDRSEIVFTRAQVPKPVDSADVSAVRRGVADELRLSGLDEVQVESFLESLEFHEVLPVVAWMTVSSDGDIWVQRGGSPADLAAESGLTDLRLNHGSSVWDRWGPDGNFIETVRFPPRFVPMQFARDEALGVWYDELGREQVAIASLGS
jgi:hypothetical protein